jgi:NAD(P)-dependent dehydrogenase (short-subunit alcohol dehydrogenase family)
MTGKSLQGRAALVTGAVRRVCAPPTAGMTRLGAAVLKAQCGRAIALALADEGANVLVHCRNPAGAALSVCPIA